MYRRIFCMTGQCVTYSIAEHSSAMHFFPSWGCIAAHFLHSLSLIIVLTSSTNKKNSWRFILPNIIQIKFISYLHILYVIYLIVRRHMTDFWYLQCICSGPELHQNMKIIMIKIKIIVFGWLLKGSCPWIFSLYVCFINLTHIWISDFFVACTPRSQNLMLEYSR